MRENLNIEEIKQTLEEQRAVLSSRLRVKMFSYEKKKRNAAANPDRADLAQDYFSRYRNSALIDHMVSTLRQVEAALKRVEKGTYGKCDKCGKDISPARLEALPYAELCIECQAQQEKHRFIIDK